MVATSCGTRRRTELTITYGVLAGRANFMGFLRRLTGDLGLFEPSFLAPPDPLSPLSNKELLRQVATFDRFFNLSRVQRPEGARNAVGRENEPRTTD